MGISVLVCVLFSKACSDLVGRPEPTPPEPTQTQICQGWEPIHLSQNDPVFMSGALARQIFTHNAHGSKLCGWDNS